MKICSRCNQPKNENKFHKEKLTKDGLTSRCKQCSHEYQQQYQKDTKETKAIKQKQYQKDNKENIAIQRTKHYQKNRKRLLKYYIDNKEKRTEYRKTNKESIKILKKRWYQNNKKEIATKSIIYRETNKKTIKIYFDKYRKNNLDKYRINGQRRRTKERSLPSTLTLLQWRTIKQYFNNECAYCGKEKPLAQEHFISLNNGGEYTINNIVPSCKSCNSSKGPKDFFEWYPTYKNHSFKRENIILKFLNYKNGQQQLKII